MRSQHLLSPSFPTSQSSKASTPTPTSFRKTAPATGSSANTHLITPLLPRWWSPNRLRSKEALRSASSTTQQKQKQRRRKRYRYRHSQPQRFLNRQARSSHQVLISPHKLPHRACHQKREALLPATVPDRKTSNTRIISRSSRSSSVISRRPALTSNILQSTPPVTTRSIRRLLRTTHTPAIAARFPSLPLCPTRRHQQTQLRSRKRLRLAVLLLPPLHSPPRLPLQAQHILTPRHPRKSRFRSLLPKPCHSLLFRSTTRTEASDSSHLCPLLPIATRTPIERDPAASLACKGPLLRSTPPVNRSQSLLACSPVMTTASTRINTISTSPTATLCLTSVLRKHKLLVPPPSLASKATRTPASPPSRPPYPLLQAR